jgi:hypothetical protein
LSRALQLTQALWQPHSPVPELQLRGGLDW